MTISLTPTRGPGEFAMLCRCIADGSRSVEAFAAMRATPEVQTAAKAAVSAGTITALAQNPSYARIVADFEAGIPSAFDALRTGGAVSLPMFTRVLILGAYSGGSADEGQWKPIAPLALANGGQLEVRKASTIRPFAKELLASLDPAAQETIRDALRAGTAKATDAVLLEILADGAPTISASGADAGDVLADLRSAVALMSPGAGTQLYLLVDTATEINLGLLSNGAGGLAFVDNEIGPVRMVVSPAIASDTSGAALVLVDASKLAVGALITAFAESGSADLQMNDSPSSGAQNLVSMFQTNSVALRAERYFGCQKLAANAAVVIESASYG
jgi:hypothetical protein